MKLQEFTPKFFSLLKAGFTKKQLTKDILAGIIVGIVALPLAIAFAIASGVSPEKGLITAVVAGLTISLLGGSRVQIGGPTGAFIIIVYGIVQEHGISGLTIATFMAGFIIIGFGLARLGNYLKFIPYPLIVGFTSGIAIIIFSSQIKDFFGLSMGEVPADFMEKWMSYAGNITKINWAAFAIALGTVIIALNFHRVSRKIPGSIVAILLSTLAVYFFEIPVETIESKFGEIPNSISLPVFPHIDFNIIQELIQPAIAIALLGSIESLLSAVVADGMMGGRHRSNMELVAQGAANIFSGLFGGIPATGAIARTATNIKNGGRRHGPRHCIAAYHAAFCPGCQAHPAVMPCRDFGGCRLAYGRMASFYGAAEKQPDGYHRPADHLLPYRLFRPDPGYRNRDDPFQFHLYEAHERSNLHTERRQYFQIG